MKEHLRAAKKLADTVYANSAADSPEEGLAIAVKHLVEALAKTFNIQLDDF